MTIDTWLLFCVTETVLCFTPGPAVLLVISLSLTRGAAAGVGASLGILSANAFYFLLSATGIGASLLASWKLFVLIKWVGAAYLAWLGLAMVTTRAAGIATLQADAPSRRRLGAYAHGVVTQIANPKSLLFFLVLLPQFLNATLPVPSQVAILAVSSISIELIVLLIYVAACQRARDLVKDPRVATALNRFGGVLLIVAALRTATIAA